MKANFVAIVAATLVSGMTALCFVPILPPSARQPGRDLPSGTLKPELSLQLERYLSMSRGRIDAAVVVREGRILVSWGDVDRPMNVASVRKSILSLLFGIAAEKGLVDLDATMAELGIDETASPLTPTEARATILDLLSSRSGIYLPGDAEGPLAVTLRPPRGAHLPGSTFHYGNWGFNALGKIFEQEIGLTIGEALADWIAGPIGMQDFGPEHVTFDRNAGPSDFPAYRIQMSARDLARLGALIAAGGVWHDRQIVPAKWIEHSGQRMSTVGPPMAEPPFETYGLSWWVDPRSGDMVAAGWGGQFLLASRQDGLSLALLNDTGTTFGRWIAFRTFGAAADGRDLMAILAILR